MRESDHPMRQSDHPARDVSRCGRYLHLRVRGA
jgi:hypothetical protein